MTIIIGRKFKNRIVLASDTMISFANGSRPEIIPGRLKAVVLGAELSIGYANYADQAVAAIQKVKKNWDIGKRNLADMFDVLCKEKMADFIVASHIEGPQLFKIREGRVTDDLNDAFVGNSDLVKLVLEGEEELSRRPQFPSDLQSQEEILFRQAFLDLFMKEGVSIREGVGGLPIFLLASPHGHTYDSYAGVCRWDSIEITPASAGTQMPEPEGGMASWGYNVQSPLLRGVATVGIAIRGISLGYVYTPLQEGAQWSAVALPNDERSAGLALQILQTETDKYAVQFGGGFEVEDLPRPPVKSIDVSMLREISLHAKKSRNKTTVLVEEDGLWVSCRSDVRGSGSMISFNELRQGSLEYILEIIDYHNAIVTDAGGL
ncbi:hypothetical protein AB9E28_31050 [Rhizobium leguminosarum]|uniref:hypothetical protein n=1 Tax=Rhizobium leguminosarum TaxID=384 RepID=UPI003F9CAB7E